MPLKRCIRGLVLSLVIPCAAAAQVFGPGTGFSGFDYRYGIPSETRLETLINRPTLISMSSEKYKDPATGERRLVGFGEAHIVYDLPISAVRALLSDPTRYPSFASMLLAVAVERRSGTSVYTYEVVGISFLGIKIGFHLRAEHVFDEIAPGELGFRIRLLESVDGNFFESFTSWYVREVVIDGKQFVYIRLYSRPGLRKPALGIDLAIKSFTPGQLKSTLEGMAREARKLATIDK